MAPSPTPFWLPRICPECQSFVSPVTPPAEGDLCRCPTCWTVLVFGEHLMLRVATAAERAGLTASEASG